VVASLVIAVVAMKQIVHSLVMGWSLCYGSGLWAKGMI
jgi:hypothetical protein